MVINKDVLKFIKNSNMQEYLFIKTDFLFHSNKIEDSTFSYENLLLAIEKDVIEGTHKYYDIIETMNSTLVFDFIVDTIDEPITEYFIKECHQLLTKNTRIDLLYNQAGAYKKIDNKLSNKLSNIDILLSPAVRVQEDMVNLLNTEEDIKSVYDVIEFHAKFEQIHPFLDGNGRIGRFLILKQCLMRNCDIFAIDEKFEREYKNALYNYQKNNITRDLYLVADLCVNQLDNKLDSYKKLLDDIYVNYINASN